MIKLARIQCGSRMYGTHLPDSDTDDVTIFLPRTNQLLGLEGVTRYGGDRSTYYLHDFVHLLLKGGPKHYELLFTDAEWVREQWWDDLVLIRDSFWCQKQANASSGYIRAELSRITRQRRWFVHDVADEEMKGYFKFKPDKTFRKHGWDVKGAYHCIRLVLQADRMVDHGRMVFPLPQDEIDLLMQVRLGEMNFDDWKNWLTCRETKWEAPEKPDMPKIVNYLHRLYKHVLDNPVQEFEVM